MSEQLDQYTCLFVFVCVCVWGGSCVHACVPVWARQQVYAFFPIYMNNLLLQNHKVTQLDIEMGTRRTPYHANHNTYNQIPKTDICGNCNNLICLWVEIEREGERWQKKERKRKENEKEKE